MFCTKKTDVHISPFSKIKEVLEGARKGKLAVLTVQETRMKGCSVIDCMEGSQCEMWEGMEGVVVWCGVHEKSRGRSKERCAFLVPNGMEGHRDTWLEGIKNSMGTTENRNF